MSLCLFSVTASLSPSLSMSMYAPIYVCVCLSVQSLFTSLTLFATCLSLSPNLPLSLDISVCPYLPLPICLFLSTSQFVPICLYLSVSSFLFIIFTSIINLIPFPHHARHLPPCPWAGASTCSWACSEPVPPLQSGFRDRCREIFEPLDNRKAGHAANGIRLTSDQPGANVIKLFTAVL